MNQDQGKGQGSAEIDMELDVTLDARNGVSEPRSDQGDWRFLAIAAYMAAGAYLVMLLVLLALGVPTAILVKFTPTLFVLLALGLFCRLRLWRSRRGSKSGPDADH